MSHRKFLFALIALALIAGSGFTLLRVVGTGADMQTAAETFIGTLSSEQKATTVLKYDDPVRFDWHFIPKASRKGLQIKDMNAEQRKAAMALLRSGLSHIGYDKAETVMALEAILRELEKNKVGGNIRDPERYYVTIFGQPGSAGKWGWSFEGHHLSLNFAVEDGRVLSTTPTFYGANPADVRNTTEGAPKNGTRVLAKEEDLAFKLLHSLDAEQRKAAVIDEKAPADIRGPAEVQPPQEPLAGLAAEKMTADQQQTLRELVAVYAANMPKDVEEKRLAAMQTAGIGKLHFAWAGADKPGVGHYYRVEGPTLLIEFVNVQPDAAGNPANHIHSVWRDMQGDFGVPRGPK